MTEDYIYIWRDRKRQRKTETERENCAPNIDLWLLHKLIYLSLPKSNVRDSHHYFPHFINEKDKHI